MKNNLISIDPSKNSIGIFVKQKTGKEMIGTIKNEFKTERQLFLNIENRLTGFLDFYNISVCLIEDYAFHIKNTRSLTSLAEMKGLIKFFILKRNIKIINVPISTWKHFSKIKVKKAQSKKSKVAYIDQAKSIYKKDFNSTDEVDAFLMYYSLMMIKKGILHSNTDLKLKELVDIYF